MICRFSALTDPGMVRSTNQDAYHIDQKGRFFIVADGMGGHAGGQEASNIATQVISSYLDKNWLSNQVSPAMLEQGFWAANQAIIEDQFTHPERSEMGTTAVMVMFRQNQPWYAYVGDSRLYRLRGSDLQQITEDHTWVARAMRGGDLTSEQARVHPWRHVLSQCLGRKDLRQIDIQPLDVQVGDRLLLCSDGLTEELSDSVISLYLRSHPEDNKAAAALVDAAKDKGGKDNITVVIVTIEASRRE